MATSIERRAPRGYILLWMIALISMVFNVLLVMGGIYTLRAYREAAAEAATQVSEATDALAGNRISNFEIPVVVNEVLPVDFTVEYSDTFQVPIDTSIPVRTSVEYSDVILFPIQETLTIDTDFDVEVTIPVINRVVPLNIPIETDVPIDLEIEVPIDIAIPVETDVPIQLTLDIPVNTTIPVNEEIPIEIDFEVAVPIEETSIPSIFDQLIEGLNGLAEMLAREEDRFKEWVP